MNTNILPDAGKTSGKPWHLINVMVVIVFIQVICAWLETISGLNLGPICGFCAAAAAYELRWNRIPHPSNRTGDAA